MRRLNPAERAFLRGYFGDALAADRIALGTSIGARSWSPYGSRISLTSDLFREPDARSEIRIDDPVAASVFAHEALHVWQRQHGRAVTRQGARLQLGYTLGLFDPYAYDATLRDPRSLLATFVLGNIEQQGRIVQDYVAADMRGHDTARFAHVARWIRLAAR